MHFYLLRNKYFHFFLNVLSTFNLHHQSMKNYSRFLPLLIIASILFSCNKRSGNPRILVFTKTAGFHHASIPDGVKAIFKLGQENKFDVDTTSNAAMFNEDSLAKYAAVVFLSNTDNDDKLFTIYEKNAFQRYIEAGGGFVGVHAASDAGYHWGWYTRLVGANFNGHPEPQTATLHIVDKDNISTKGLPDPWVREDEWYNFKNLNKDVHVLITIDEKSYKGGTNGETHPMAWYHDFDGGRAWYTELGHTPESYTDPNFLKHLLGGIKYAMDDNRKLDYAKVKTPITPAEDRFTRVQLVQGTFFEPTELTVLPNLDVLVAQRRGEIMLYKNDTKQVKQAGFLDVYWKTQHTPGVNAEEGLLGIKKDPDFAKNHFVYIYYSPADTSVNRLSRFKLENDSIDPKSEKIILQFYEQREICCHTGGSIAFGKDHLLYLSTGDNTTPFNERHKGFNTNGFAPLDDRPGFEHYDDRRSAGNTNDLRGKILRIHINDDGSYSIPDNNLFPKGKDSTRPEIYVMGDRNPYRISVDQKNGYLYWGEVGPDANNDSLETRGPRGYDEMNQARKAGYFGWPFFIANNIPYRPYDYATGKSGEPFDPQRPVNNSRNNTGLRILPPAQPAYIWYPYAESKDFPQVGTGGRCAMSGPVYYSDLYADSTRYPDYFDGKWFIYDWIRNWIKVVTMTPDGDFDNMEPFMDGTKFNNPSDMEVGPDGRLYMVEYGSGWFAKNDNAGLIRIDYNGGNRPPNITGLSVNKTSGDLPLQIIASVEAKDPDKDPVSYIWHIGKDVEKKTTEPTLQYTLNKAGDYAISVDVLDDEKATSTSNTVNVYAGNEAPTVNVKIEGNKTFYFPGTPVKYDVAIQDKDDNSTDINNLMVTADYSDSHDKAGNSTGHQSLTRQMAGKNLMLSLDCKGCHKVDTKSVGPAFIDVSKRYQKNPQATAILAEKIIKGGSGNWGEVAMAAHPNLKESDAKQIVSWILSLSNENKEKSLPQNGSVDATLKKPVNDNGILSIYAAYTDKGGDNIKPLMGEGAVQLRNSKMTFGEITKMEGYSKITFNGNSYLIIPAEGWFRIDSIDLTGINKAALNMGWQRPPVPGYTFELHLDSPEGKKIGEFTFAGKEGTGKEDAGKGGRKPEFATITSAVSPVTDGQFHNLYIVSKIKDRSETGTAALSSIQFFVK
jgi:glucose/arabinose dehydrogenase/cytochrome c551/c552/type 1 glutamine amidotransferase